MTKHSSQDPLSLSSFLYVTDLPSHVPRTVKLVCICSCPAWRICFFFLTSAVLRDITLILRWRMRIHKSSIAPATPHVTILPMCSPCVHKPRLPLPHMNSTALCCVLLVFTSRSIWTVQPSAPALPPCCTPIKFDLHFAISLAHIFSAPDLQTASTPRPFDVSHVMPTG